MLDRSPAELINIFSGAEKIFFRKFPGDIVNQVNMIISQINEKGQTISDAAVKQEVFKVHDLLTAKIEDFCDEYGEVFRKKHKEKTAKIIKAINDKNKDEDKKDKFDLDFNALGLSLLDDSQAEYQVISKNLELKLIEKLGEAFADLNLRVQQITGSELNPLTPETVSDAISAATYKITNDPKTAKIAAELFKDILAEDFKNTYEEINRYFIGKQIIPDIKAFKRSQHAANPGAARKGSEAYLFDEMDEGGQPGAGMPGGMGSGGDNTPYVPGMPVSPVEMQRIVDSFASIMRSAPMFAGIAANMTDSQIQEQIANSAYLTNMDNMQRMREVQKVAAATAPPLIDGVAQYQTSNVLKGLPVEGNEINTIDQVVFDLTSLVFDKIFEQERLPDHLKYLIGKLQIPVLREALKDKQFFTKKDVPVRRFLDFLATSEIVFNQKYFDPVEKIINELLNKDDLTQEMFEESLTKINELFEKEHEAEDKIVDTVQPELKKEDLVHQYYDQVINKLENSIQNAKFDPVKAFIEKIWAKLYVKKWFDKIIEHKGNFFAAAPPIAVAEFNATLAWFDILVWSTNLHNPNEENIGKLKQFLPAIGNGLKKVCANIGIPKPLETKLFNILAEKHISLIKNTHEQVKEKINQESAKIVSEYKKTEEADGIVATKEIKKEIGAEGINFDEIFYKGAWFDFINVKESDGRKEKIKVKLLWVSPQKHVYLFSSPNKKFNKQLSKSQVWRHYRVKDLRPADAPDWDSQKIIDNSITIFKTKSSPA